jgi:hypothetical protein
MHPELSGPDSEPWPAAEHAVFRLFLSGARARDLPALRHLVSCPLCERLARVVLLGFLGAAPEPPG